MVKLQAETGKSRSGTAVRKRGKARVVEILDAAQHILVQDGLANLTTRRVADALGISVGNLAYYFPSKEKLLQAIIEHVIEGYDAALKSRFRHVPDDPLQRLEAFLKFSIEDSKKPEVQAFFYQFWGYSTSNAEAQAYRTKMYGHFAAQLRALLNAVHPDMGERDLDNMTYTVLCVTEGLHVIHGTRGAKPVSRRAFDDYIFRKMIQLCEVNASGRVQV